MLIKAGLTVLVLELKNQLLTIPYMETTMVKPDKLSFFANDIAKDLLHIGSIEFNLINLYEWVSGIKSPIYCDTRKVISNVEIRKKIVDAFIYIIKDKFTSVEIIAGVATGGIPLGVLIADLMHLPFIYVRQEPKKHGLMKQVEGMFYKGQSVVLIEDLISTGGSSFKAIEGLKKEQLNVLGLISTMTYKFKSAEELFANNKIDHQSVCDLDTIVDIALNLEIISSKDKDSILAFRDNPSNWKH